MKWLFFFVKWVLFFIGILILIHAVVASYENDYNSLIFNSLIASLCFAGLSEINKNK